MKITIHQPEYLPWLGFFDKIRQCELLVLLDHVPFTKNYFQNRNRIRGINGPVWMTVPVKTKGKFNQPIREVEIDNANPWKRKNLNTLLQNYSKAPFFDQYAPFFNNLYQKDWPLLSELNETCIRYLLEQLGIATKLVRSSSLDPQGKKSDLILDICKKTGASSYLSGISGKEYLHEPSFREAGIEIQYQEFHHPIYTQLHEPFISCMSAVDLLFNHGPKSLEIIQGIGAQTMEQLFH